MKRQAKEMRALVALTTAIAVSLAGCGGGSSDSQSTTQAGPTSQPPPTDAGEKAGYVRRADAICRAANRRIGALATPTAARLRKAQSSPLGTTELLVRPGTKILDREATRLRALQPRPTDPSLETFLGLWDPILLLADERLGTTDVDQAVRLEREVAVLEGDQEQAARRFGLRVCGPGFTQVLSSAATR
jgi:hypothetical protein